MQRAARRRWWAVRRWIEGDLMGRVLSWIQTLVVRKVLTAYSELRFAFVTFENEQSRPESHQLTNS